MGLWGSKGGSELLRDVELEFRDDEDDDEDSGWLEDELEKISEVKFLIADDGDELDPIRKAPKDRFSVFDMVKLGGWEGCNKKASSNSVLEFLGCGIKIQNARTVGWWLLSIQIIPNWSSC